MFMESYDFVFIDGMKGENIENGSVIEECSSLL